MSHHGVCSAVVASISSARPDGTAYHTYLSIQLLFRPSTASNCCYQGHLGVQKWYVSVSSIKKWYVVFFIFAVSSSIIAFVADTQLCRSPILTNTQCGVRYVACHVQVASLPWSQWCSDWCALGCSAAVAFSCVCLSHVSGRVTLVAVFAVVTTWSVLLSVVSGGRILCGPSERWSAGSFFHGIRLQAAAASCAHVSCSGGRSRWHGCKCS